MEFEFTVGGFRKAVSEDKVEEFLEQWIAEAKPEVSFGSKTFAVGKADALRYWTRNFGNVLEGVSISVETQGKITKILTI